jgi:hypothetical protein
MILRIFMSPFGSLPSLHSIDNRGGLGSTDHRRFSGRLRRDAETELASAIGFHDECAPRPERMSHRVLSVTRSERDVPQKKQVDAWCDRYDASSAR